MENNKKPILIFFDDCQRTKDAKNLEYNYPERYIFNEKNKIFVFLNHAKEWDLLQKNYLIFNIGKKLFNFCKKGNFYIDFVGDDQINTSNFFLGWSLMDYSFDKFKQKKKNDKKPKLIYSNNSEISKQTKSIFFVRDLINTPANILGPQEFYDNAKIFLGKNFQSQKLSGNKLKREFPLIDFVGAGSDISKQPVFGQFRLKKKNNKKTIFIIGKGVTFDTGGLNLKLGAGMSLMKKDMGGAANTVGLGKIISQSQCNFNLTLLLGLVENSVSATSMRPSDIIKSREGYYVEIGNTDAEGRLVLADLITYASEFKPDLIIDLATLTGASRVALGLDVPSFFTNNELIAEKLKLSSNIVGDPLWRLPLWESYNTQLYSNHADFTNIGNSGFGGAITAALFLKKFVKDIPWIHVDMMAWSKSNYYSKYEGGDAMGIRALVHFLITNYN